MKAEIKGSPAFGHIHFELMPGETLVTESGAMASMAANLDMQAVMSGGFLTALVRRLLGQESFFVNVFTNRTQQPLTLQVTAPTPGDVREIQLQNSLLFLERGAYLCSSPGIRLGVRWAGLRSWLTGEGLFKLAVSGSGHVWLATYGAMFEKNIQGEYLVDTGHLVAYEPQIRLRLQMAGGLFSSIFGGEGLVARLEGKGRVILQTRSLGGFAQWLNPKL